MLRARNVYFAGVFMLSAAALESGVTSATVVAGLGLILYGFGCALRDS